MFRPVFYLKRGWSGGTKVLGKLSVPVLLMWIIAGHRRWFGGAMVLGKLPVPGRPINLDKSRAMAYCACSRCEWNCNFFLSAIISLFFLPLSGRRPDID